jgi:hypothetical protein
MRLAPLLANAGIPMLVVYWMGAFFLIIPIVLVEGALYRHLTHDRWGASLWVAFWANAASTLAGIPLVWGAFFLLELLSNHPDPNTLWGLVQTAAWLPPLSTEDTWRVPAAALILSVPFFLVSVAVEGAAAKMVADAGTSRVWDWSWRANTVTYGALALSLVWMLRQS